MNLDEQLRELLTRLGVTLEEPGSYQEEHTSFTANTTASSNGRLSSTEGGERGAFDANQGMAYWLRRRQLMEQRDDEQEQYESADGCDGLSEQEAHAPAEISLFQTSREHYGVFYRLDLVSGAPQLRIFAPDEENTLKMRCYLVRPSLGTPVREWFLSTRAHDGSDEYEESRETVEQHLLFAAGEALKRLFWTGEMERMRFPDEIEVARVA